MSGPTIDRILTIVREHELDVVTVFSADGAKLDHVGGSTEDVCTAIQLVPESFDGTITIEAYQEQKGTVRGRKKDVDKPFRWKVQGRASAPIAAPIQSAPQTKEVKVPDLDSIREAANSKAEARIAEHGRTHAEQEAAELRGRLAIVEQERDELLESLEEEEDEPEAMGAAPWYADEEKTVRMLSYIRALFGLRDKPATPPVLAAEGITEDERAMVEAFRTYAAAHPSDAKEVQDNLITNFGTKRTDNEQAE